MQRSVWTLVMTFVVTIGLIASSLASAYGLVVLAADLLVEHQEWDGVGTVFGLLILVVALPIAAMCVGSLRLLRQRG